MINIYVNLDGYYITGPNIEIAARCPMQPDVHPLLHQYAVIFAALIDLRSSGSKDDVIVYNDSRIIEELNGTALPLTPDLQNWNAYIKQTVIPMVSGIVFFRKKNASFLAQKINAAFISMLPPVDPIAFTMDNNKVRNQKQEKIDKLKKAWFSDDRS